MQIGSSRRSPSGTTDICFFKSCPVIRPATVMLSPKKSLRIAYEIGEMPGARYYSAGGKLVGAVLTGDIRRMEEVTNLILQA